VRAPARPRHHPAHRLAHRQKKARPEEILALTFTDKAAAEMEERVDTLVQYGYADVEISTFHAFGDRILREHALEMGLQPDFRVLNRAEQVIFFRDRLFEFPLVPLPSARRPDSPHPRDHHARQPLQGRGHLAPRSI